jgi:hypothetical protein
MGSWNCIEEEEEEEEKVAYRAPQSSSVWTVCAWYMRAMYERVSLSLWAGFMIIVLVLLMGIENCYAEVTHHFAARSAGKNK